MGIYGLCLFVGVKIRKMLNRKSLQEVKTTETNLTISVVPQNIDSHSLDLLIHVNPSCIALTLSIFLPLLNFLENRVYI